MESEQMLDELIEIASLSEGPFGDRFDKLRADSGASAEDLGLLSRVSDEQAVPVVPTQGSDVEATGGRSDRGNLSAMPVLSAQDAPPMGEQVDAETHIEIWAKRIAFAVMNSADYRDREAREQVVRAMREELKHFVATLQNSVPRDEVKK